MKNTSKITNRAPFIILKALLQGREVQIGKNKYYYDSEINQVGFVDGEYYYFDKFGPFSLNKFFQLCRDTSEEDLVGIAASNVLNDIRDDI